MKKIDIVFAACSEVKTEGEATWFQTFPAYGRYPVGGIIPKADPKAEFVFDEASAKIVIDAFNAAKAGRPDWPGILVDREHFSTDRDKVSDAMAWATDIRQEEDGSIWTKWEFTPAGRELWESKTLVNRSPFFACTRSDDGLEFRPLELISIGMTNTPHFKELSNLAAARAAEVTNTQGDNKTMNKLIALLGLAEGASEEDVLAAVKALQDKASAAETAKAEAEKAKDDAEAKCRKMECDAFIEANKAKIADEAACREVYMANPEAAAKLIAACKEASKPAEPQTVLASAKKTPASTSKKVFASAREEMNSLPCDQRQAFYLAHKDEIDG